MVRVRPSDPEALRLTRRLGSRCRAAGVCARSGDSRRPRLLHSMVPSGHRADGPKVRGNRLAFRPESERMPRVRGGANGSPVDEPDVRSGRLLPTNSIAASGSRLMGLEVSSGRQVPGSRMPGDLEAEPVGSSGGRALMLKMPSSRRVLMLVMPSGRRALALMVLGCRWALAVMVLGCRRALALMVLGCRRATTVGDRTARSFGTGPSRERGGPVALGSGGFE